MILSDTCKNFFFYCQVVFHMITTWIFLLIIMIKRINSIKCNSPHLGCCSPHVCVSLLNDGNVEE